MNHLTAIAKESTLAVAQVENNSREPALKGNLPGVVQRSVVRAQDSHHKLATQVLSPTARRWRH